MAQSGNMFNLMNFYGIMVALTMLTVVCEARNRKYGCGELPRSFSVPTIIGGKRAQNGSWPWIASIRLRANNGREHACAGTLIGKRFVLTAAHCVTDARRNVRRASSLTVVVGTQTLGALHSTSRESVLNVIHIHMHPLYNSPEVRPWAYDMAILELEGPPEHADVSRPICLPMDDVAPLVGEECMVAGWGKTEHARFSRHLMHTTLPIISRRECNHRDNWDGYIDTSMLCALRKEGRTASSCQGDSGGPLICKRDTQWYVYGVISWGPVICGDKPAVFTNVAHVSGWIQQVLEEAEDIDPGSKNNLPSYYRLNNTPRGDFERPPCDAVQFERKYGYMLYGPAPRDYTLEGISVRECMNRCCQRGHSQCQSFLYYHKERKCLMRKTTRCDANVLFLEQTDRNLEVNGPVTYYGRKECQGRH